MTLQKRIALVVLLAGIAGAIFYFESQKPAPSVREELAPQASAQTSTASTDGISATTSAPAAPDRTAIIKAKAKKYSRGVELAGPTGFINTEPFKLASLVGKKVILIDIWTYSCINCLRTIPYLNAWYEKYKDKGLVIVGVHSPEFEFEKKYENVAAEVKRLGIKYPVVLDSNHATWNAYGNFYWPSGYLIDVDGFVVHHTTGEGRYPEKEREIQKALEELAAARGEVGAISNANANSPAEDTDFSKVGSPEIYFGAARNEYLANAPSGKTGLQTFTSPANVSPNSLYLSGSWNIQNEFAENASAGAKIIFRYNAKRVFLVASADFPVTLSITRDGKPLGATAGADVVSGKVTVGESRLYKLIDDPAGYGEHTIEITIEKPGLKAFTFTFG